MADLLPIAAIWTDDEVLKPVGGHIRTAQKQFVIGQEYIINPNEQRSSARHKAYMAYVTQAWRSLPDILLTEYPSPDHLRKRGLIKTGFCQVRDLACSSRAEAMRIAAFIRPSNEYALIVVSNAVVREYTAESQSYKAMGKIRFNKSQEAVENWIGELIAETHGVVFKDERKVA